MQASIEQRAALEALRCALSPSEPRLVAEQERTLRFVAFWMAIYDAIDRVVSSARRARLPVEADARSASTRKTMR